MSRVAEDAARSSRRERRKREVRDRIFEAAVALFVERGVEQTTLDDIADSADVARATVYNHFARKSDILSEWGARNRERLRDSIDNEEFRALPLREQLIAGFDLLVEVYEADRRTARIIFGLASGELLGESPELAMILADLVREAQRSGEARPDLDPWQVGLVLRASYLDTIYRWSFGTEEPPFDLRAALRQLVDVVVRPIDG